MKTRQFAVAASSLLLLISLFCSQANAAPYKWLDHNGDTHFGDRVPDRYRHDIHKVTVYSNTMQKNDTRAVESRHSSRAYPQFADLSQYTDAEWEQRVREMQEQRRKVDERNKAQALKPTTPKRTPAETRGLKKQYQEYQTLQLKAQQNNANPRSRTRQQQPKSYEQRMREYKKSQECFNQARNVNGTINAAAADMWGCKDVPRPRRD